MDVTKVTNVGLGIITNLMIGSGTLPRHVIWGTSATAAADVTDTDLEAEGTESRVEGTVTRQTTTVANDTHQVVATLTADGTKTIKELGIYDAATLGNLYLRATFADIGLNSGDAVAFTIQTVFAQSA